MLVKWAIKIGAGILLFLAGILFWHFIKSSFWGGSDASKKEVIKHQTTLEQIEALGKLELVKYTFKDILEYKVDRPWYQGGDSKTLLIVAGEAVGCIDLTKIRKEHILEKDSVMIIQLPKPELCYVKVNQQDSRVYEVETGFMTFDEAKLIETAYKEAEKQVAKTALESNIMEQTKKNAELILKPTLEQIARKKVVFRYDLTGVKIETETKPIFQK
jgi:hypothetical protein